MLNLLQIPILRTDSGVVCYYVRIYIRSMSQLIFIVYEEHKSQP